MKESITIKTYDEIATLPGLNPDIAVIPADFDLSGCEDEISAKSYVFTEIDKYLSIVKHAHFPLTDRLNSQEIKNLYRLVEHGTIIIIQVDAKNQQQLRFSELLLSRFWWQEEQQKDKSLREEEPCSAFLQEVCKKIVLVFPFVAGCSNLKGTKLNNGLGEVIVPIWSCYWKLSTQKLRESISEAIISFLAGKKSDNEQLLALPDISGFYIDLLKVMDKCFSKYCGFDLDVIQDEHMRLIHRLYSEMEKLIGMYALKHKNINIYPSALIKALRDGTEWIVSDKNSPIWGNLFNRIIFNEINKLTLMPHPDILNDANKSVSRGCLLIDQTSLGHPVAFARKFGEGSIVVLPACLSIDKITKNIQSLHHKTGKLGYDLIKTWSEPVPKNWGAEDFDKLNETDRPKTDNTVSIEFIDFNIREEKKLYYSVHIKIKVNGKEKKPTALTFMRFLVLYTASYGHYDGMIFSKNASIPFCERVMRNENGKRKRLPCSFFLAGSEGVKPPNYPDTVNEVYSQLFEDDYHHIISERTRGGHREGRKFDNIYYYMEKISTDNIKIYITKKHLVELFNLRLREDSWKKYVSEKREIVKELLPVILDPASNLHDALL